MSFSSRSAYHMLATGQEVLLIISRKHRLHFYVALDAPGLESSGPTLFFFSTVVVYHLLSLTIVLWRERDVILAPGRVIPPKVSCSNHRAVASRKAPSLTEVGGSIRIGRRGS